ncbi:MAG: sugar phosphate isomerase/epimerase [Opitutaceae bacterium]|nr:sugar phosphate isomerase/epimerase [Opitutaceae bacterium]
MSFLRTFSTLGCPELNLEEVLDLAERQGVGAVELRCLGGSTDIPGQLTAAYGTPAALATRLAKSSVRVVALDTSLKLAGGTEADWAAVQAFIPWAEALGGLRLRVFDGGTAGDPAAPRQVAAGWQRWRELRRRQGWKTDLMVETHDSLFDAARIQACLGEAPDCAILWDSHHTWKKGGEAPVATWTAIKASVVHVHIKDSVDRPSARHPYTYVLPGAGVFPWSILRPVLAAEFKGPISLEWERQWHPYLPPLEEALRAATHAGWW